MQKKRKKRFINQAKARKSNSRTSINIISIIPKSSLLLILIIILAISFRVVYLIQALPSPIFHGMVQDTEEYDKLARLMLKGNFLTEDSIYLNTLYPFFLAAIYFIFGVNHLPVAIIQIILDAVSCLLLYFIASSLFDKKTGIVSAFIYAFYGMAIFYCGIILAPTLLIFLSLVFIGLLIIADKNEKWLLFLFSGLCFGLLYSGRPNVILFSIVLAFWFFRKCKSKKEIPFALKNLAFFAIGFLIIITPISLRYYKFEKRLTTSTLGGMNFYIGNNPDATGYFMTPHGTINSPIEQVKSTIRFAEKETGRKMTGSEASDYWLSKGLDYIKQKPFDAFVLYLRKFALFWRYEEVATNINYYFCKSFIPIMRFPFISFGIIAPLALLGIICFLVKRKIPFLILGFILTYSASVIIIFINARYRLLVVPYLIICSSFTLFSLWKWIKSKEIKKITVCSAALLFLFIGVNKRFDWLVITSTASAEYNNLGTVYLSDGQYYKAVNLFKKSIELDPEYVNAYSNLGQAYMKLGMHSDTSYFIRARRSFEKAIEINPQYYKAYISMGVTYLNQGLYEKAENNLNHALDINPESHYAYHNLGILYLKQGLNNKAIESFQKAIQIKPEFFEAHNYLGLLYYQNGDFKNASDHYHSALKINPESYDSYYNLGILYDKQDQIDKATESYKRAIKINPQDFRAHQNLGVVFAKQNRLKEAIKQWETVLRLKPGFKKAVSNIQIAKKNL